MDDDISWEMPNRLNNKGKLDSQQSTFGGYAKRLMRNSFPRVDRIIKNLICRRLTRVILFSVNFTSVQHFNDRVLSGFLPTLFPVGFLFLFFF